MGGLGNPAGSIIPPAGNTLVQHFLRVPVPLFVLSAASTLIAPWHWIQTARIKRMKASRDARTPKDRDATMNSRCPSKSPGVDDPGAP